MDFKGKILKNTGILGKPFQEETEFQNQGRGHIALLEMCFASQKKEAYLPFSSIGKAAEVEQRNK